MQSCVNHTIHGNCRDDFHGDNFKNIWFPRESCERLNKYDLRTPGLMKLEFKGTQIIGLCSKSYIALNKDENAKNEKDSLKDVNKRSSDPSDSFIRVLKTQAPITTINRV